MNGGALIWIALGGAAGSVIRAVIGMSLHARFPWATLLVNTAGSLLIGWLMTRLGGLEPDAFSRWHALLVVGFCGGFTTFSTFSWQTLELMQRGEWAAAVTNVLLSVTLCLLAVWLGCRLAQFR
jgi:CrcB protein